MTGPKPSHRTSTSHFQLASGRLLLLLACALTLQACSVFKGNTADQDSQSADSNTESQPGSSAPLAFVIDVQSENRSVARHLDRYLDIQKFNRFPDLRTTEFNRLMAEADTNARSLLAALGYFNPDLKMRVEELPAGDEAPRKIIIEVEPGEQAHIEDVAISFADPMNSDPASARQRQRVERNWSLKPEAVFTQSDWDGAKSSGLRTLQRDRYPTARIANSKATVNADTEKVDLDIHYDPGQPYRFGDIQLKGNERYDAQGIKNIARIPTGADYSEEALLDAQQRLANSGYFDSAFLVLDTENGDPQNADVIAQLREAKYQKAVFGIGLSTDAGPRISLDHTHNKIWPLGWRAVSQIAIDAKSQLLATTWTAMPKESGWAWFAGTQLERAETGDYTANSFKLTGGRTKSVGHIDRSYYLQYDFSRTEGSNTPGSASSLLASYSWTGRYFNNKTNPTGGYGLGWEMGAGYTLTPARDPFLRAKARWTQFVPVGKRDEESGRRSRLAFRAEGGAIVAKTGVQVPLSLLFLTGGDTTVRGYSYESIGTRSFDDRLYGGRYLSVGSIEWQRPITLFGNQTDWEHAVFIDTGSVADSMGSMNLYTGVGTGIRWKSPVGPLQTDIAYGLKRQQLRLHLRMGFQF